MLQKAAKYPDSPLIIKITLFLSSSKVTLLSIQIQTTTVPLTNQISLISAAEVNDQLNISLCCLWQRTTTHLLSKFQGNCRTNQLSNCLQRRDESLSRPNRRVSAACRCRGLTGIENPLQRVRGTGP
ncbi:hypothetical protein ILYODFUR_032172 [Ilyodon furcidens]|uniref:Uncharacterized protein n=1 Tax=Ilyodon furcidens TaxID=33524 RepID=A0ABV0UX11_9TELE